MVQLAATVPAAVLAEHTITMGGDTCPFYPGVTYRDWKLDDDPAGQPVDTVRAIRDDIPDHVHALIAELIPGDA